MLLTSPLIHPTSNFYKGRNMLQQSIRQLWIKIFRWKINKTNLTTKLCTTMLAKCRICSGSLVISQWSSFPILHISRTLRAVNIKRVSNRTSPALEEMNR